MKYTYLLFLIFFGTINSLQAQHYGNSLGIRLGNNDLGRTVGLSFQQRISKRNTIEAILQSDFSRNTTAHILYEIHRPIISKRLNYYYGGGLAFGSEESFMKDAVNKEIVHTYGNSTVGVDFILGFEMTFLNTVFSFDYKPNINVAGREEFFRGQAGISARMVLVKSKDQKKRQRQRQRAKNQQNTSSFGEKINSIFKKN